MRKILASLLAGCLLCGMSACSSAPKVEMPEDVNGVSAISTAVSIKESSLLSPGDGLILTETESQDKVYQNPVLDLSNENAKQFGDPFIMRWNGMYYLYPSANGDTGVQCWISEDLINWTYTGICTVDDVFHGAWAPEVEYYNGKFYMSTTGFNGEGDYILTSDSPTGPFVISASELNTNFDSDIFVDDKGDWYMYFPYSGDTIRGLKMSSPLSPELWTLTDLRLNVASGAWTEGPMVIKHKDTYFMTYCGGGVVGPGYQIHYATTDGDMLNFTPGENYPLILNTDLTSYPGLGHNSLVTGPDLDSLYIIYHSMPWEQQPRVMMIDPLFINGDFMQSFGPTLSVQQAPEMPDIYSRFDSEESLSGWTAVNAVTEDSKLKLSAGGAVISENGIEGDFTAEFNFLSINDVDVEGSFIPSFGKAGAIFDYTDSDNYGAAYIDIEGQILEIVFTVDGKETVYKEYLHASFEDQFDFSKLQLLTVKKYGNKYRFLFNNLTVCEYESDLKGGAVGVSCLSGSADIGFVGVNGSVWHSCYKEYYKPVEGEFCAILCAENGINTAEYNGREYLSVSGGECYNYYVNAEASCSYDLGMKYRSAEGMSFELYHNGMLVYQGSAPASESDRTEVFRGIELPQGYGVLTLKVTEGSADIFNYEFITSTAVPEEISFDLSAPLYSEGEWNVEDGKFIANTAAKFLYGDREWSDYLVSATFTSKGDYLAANMIFRATKESLTPDYSFTECQSYFLGYSVTVFHNGDDSYVSLNKDNYGKTELVRFDTEIPFNTPVEVTAEAVGEDIRVYLNGELVIEYSDPEPFMKGAAGFSNISSAAVGSLSVKPLGE